MLPPHASLNAEKHEWKVFGPEPLYSCGTVTTMLRYALPVVADLRVFWNIFAGVHVHHHNKIP